MARGSTPCSLCERPAWSRGFCNACYARERSHGRLPKIHGKELPRVLMTDEDTKPCRVCGEVRKGFEFWADRKARDGKQNTCRVCSAKQVAEWKERNPEKARAIRQRRTEIVQREWRQWAYGLTPEQHQAMLEAQNHVCALCGRPPKTRQLAVDHDHSTGVVRGLLCSPCNTGLGKLGDSIEGLQRAIDYLRRSETS